MQCIGLTFQNIAIREYFGPKASSPLSVNYSGLTVVSLSSRAYFTLVLFINIRFGIANIYDKVKLMQEEVNIILYHPQNPQIRILDTDDFNKYFTSSQWFKKISA